MVNNLAYKLRIEDNPLIGRTFHVDLLKPFTGQVPSTKPKPALSYGSPVPTTILARRTVRNQPQWKVKWSAGESSWETDETMQGFSTWPSMRDAFKPKPRARKSQPENPTPWKGWAWATEEPSSTTSRPETTGELPRLRQ